MASAVRDSNRVPGLVAQDTITSTAEGATSLSLSAGSVIAPTVAIVDGSGNQITSFGSTPITNYALETGGNLDAIETDLDTLVAGITISTALPAGTNNIGTVSPALASTEITGQKKITASAVQLGSNVLTNGVIFTALSTNTGNIFIGGSGVTTTADGTGSGYILEPGSSTSAAVTNTNLFYVIGTANDVLSWIGS